MALDYGSKRIGVAATDPLQLIASGLTTVHPNEIIPYLKKYLEKENVECIVVGEPKNLDNTPSRSAGMIDRFVAQLARQFPGVVIEREDERFTSKIAAMTLVDSGLKKKQRQNKALIDEVSATLILQSYLERKSRLY